MLLSDFFLTNSEGSEAIITPIFHFRNDNGTAHTKYFSLFV
jgi:hypothetical protein